MDEKRKLVKNDDSPGFGCRHTLVALGFLGFMIIYAIRVNLSVALVAMVKPIKTPVKENYDCPLETNGTHASRLLENKGMFDWSFNVQGWILSAFFYGYSVTQIPAGILVQRIGGKKLLGFGVLTAALMNFTIPFISFLGPIAVFIVRFLDGLGEGLAFPAMHFMLGKWAPLSERSRLSSFCYAGCQLGIVISISVTGFLSSSETFGGWPTTFYLFGGVGCVFFVVWMLVVHDTPADHPRITPEERDYIERSLPQGKKADIPWRAIFTSLPMYAVSVAHFTWNWGFYTLLTGMPTYMKDVLGFDISVNGLLSSLPYFACLVVMNIVGPTADYLRRTKCLSLTGVRKLFNTLGTIVPAVCLVLIQVAGCNTTATVSILIFSVGTCGFGVAGFNINHIDLAPDFAGTLIGITNTFATIPGMVGPLVIGYLTDIEQSRDQWQIVFYLASAVYVVGAVFFLIFGSGDLQEWGAPQKKSSPMPEMTGIHDTNEFIKSKYKPLYGVD